ncbi:MAG: galactokinase [Planctomycetaceae bacterium]|nr:galactokinase [Planctomycetaceae bacterium]
MSVGASENTLVQEALELFDKHFGRSPRWVVAAPGRVNLIGEHTDYNAGFVLPMAIERRVVIAADRPIDPALDGQACVVSSAEEVPALLAVDGDIRPGDVHWSSYLQGVVAGCLAKGLKPGPFEAVVHSDVPLGGGLSSSAALEVATATLIEAITGQTLDLVTKALLCQKAEHEYARMPCGIMDQFISVMGQADHLMLLDCRSEQARMVTFDNPALTVLITNSNVKHELTGSEYPLRRAACEETARLLNIDALRDASTEMLEGAKDELSDEFYRRARHVIGEIERTVEAARAIEQGDWTRVGELMYASHNSLRDDYEVSCPELDSLVEIAGSIGREGGVIGSRMTGGGFGGCTVTLVETDKVDAVRETLCTRYREKTGIEPTSFASRPAQGACIIR